jgi:hypothetical protein
VEDVEEYWVEASNALKETAEEVLGFATGNRKEWISEDSWKKIEERNELKKKINEMG